LKLPQFDNKFLKKFDPLPLKIYINPDLPPRFLARLMYEQRCTYKGCERGLKIRPPSPRERCSTNLQLKNEMKYKRVYVHLLFFFATFPIP